MNDRFPEPHRDDYPEGDEGSEQYGEALTEWEKQQDGPSEGELERIAERVSTPFWRQV